MCRFVAYLAKDPILLADLIEKPENSLIKQSRHARGTKTGLNADGVGVGWYDRNIDHLPATFKSILPAWNDENLKHLVTKVRSSCFVGHVRASTVGDVTLHNCHPFTYQQWLFAHNGTVRGFDKIKRKVISLLDEEIFKNIRGQTDSEYVLALIVNELKKFKIVTLEYMLKATRQAIHQLNELQQLFNNNQIMKLNSVLTDGEQLIATRYVSDQNSEPLSLYYVVDAGGITVASEPLTDYHTHWRELPLNHFLTADKDLTVKIEKI